MTARLSPTEALLSQAAAVTAREVHLARVALIETGGAVIRDLDVSLLVSGDGTAGNELLGGPRRSGWTPRCSCAIRSSSLLRTAVPDPFETRPAGSRP